MTRWPSYFLLLSTLHVCQAHRAMAQVTSLQEASPLLALHPRACFFLSRSNEHDTFPSWQHASSSSQLHNCLPPCKVTSPNSFSISHVSSMRHSSASCYSPYMALWVCRSWPAPGYTETTHSPHWSPHLCNLLLLAPLERPKLQTCAPRALHACMKLPTWFPPASRQPTGHSLHLRPG